MKRNSKEEKEVIQFFMDRDLIYYFYFDDTIVRRAMEQLGLSRETAQRYNQEYVVLFREKLNSFIQDQDERQIPEEEIVNSCVEKFELKKNDVSEYVRRLRIHQTMDELEKRLFEGLVF